MLQAAQLVSAPETFTPGYEDKSLIDCLRIMHFESRYTSIDQLLADLSANNILELSSGFSFRGLDAVQHRNVHYIDTDLAGVVEEKQKLIIALQKDTQIIGKLDLLPLNALDEEQFNNTIDRFSDGPLTIVNEGLLMYLNTEEKRKLLTIIHNALSNRGGYWITADIYVKNPLISKMADPGDKLEKFFEQHHIEENKFDSFETAEAFFKECGFAIDKEAEIDYSQLKALPYVMQKTTPEQLTQMRSAGKMNATWRMKVL